MSNVLTVLIIIFVALSVYSVCIVVRIRKRTGQELSGAPGIYTGPAGEPTWDGILPDKVDDYVEPRYVYENLRESTDFLPENGRIIGYRISPDLVIHSRVQGDINPPLLLRYVERWGGKMLNWQDVQLLQKNWEAVSNLRVKAGDTPLNDEWFWATIHGLPVLAHYKGAYYKDVGGIASVWSYLILKR